MVKVSVITPCYNAEKFITEVYNSLKDQSIKDFEWIVINDGSTDTTNELISQLVEKKELNITYISNPINMGVAYSRNLGIDKAKGIYVCFLDADDIWAPDKLDAQLKFMEKHNAKLSYMDYYKIDALGNVIKKISAPIYCNYDSLLKTNVLGNLTCMVELDLIKDIRFINHGHEDYIFWLSVLKKIFKAEKVNNDEVLCYYREHGNSLSSNKLKAAIWQWRIYRRVINLNLFKSVYYFCHYAISGFIKHSKQ